MMQFAHRHLHSVKGLSFYKLMGTGKGDGFSPWADFSTYALLQVWDAENRASEFFEESPLMEKYRYHSVDQWTLFMRSIKAHGFWSKKQPFESSNNLSPKIPYLAIITRATIRKRKLLKFWKYVPTSEKPLKDNAGLIYTKGVGEVPILQMATFSIWKNIEALNAFAYSSKEHIKAIKLTRELDWYSEELFSRFQPYKSVGRWHGANPLPSLEGL